MPHRNLALDVSVRRNRALKRSRLNRIGAIRKRRAGIELQFRVETIKRANRRCERCGVMPQADDRLDAHHMVSRARGVGWPGLWEAELNGLCVCRRCHDHLTKWPRDEQDARSHRDRIERAYRAFDCWRLNGPES